MTKRPLLKTHTSLHPYYDGKYECATKSDRSLNRTKKIDLRKKKNKIKLRNKIRKIRFS